MIENVNRKTDSFFFKIESLNFLIKLLKTKDSATLDQIKQKQIPQFYLQYFTQLKTLLEKFRVQALTLQKALDSIQYNDSEVSRKILTANKNIKPNEIVAKDLAL